PSGRRVRYTTMSSTCAPARRRVSGSSRLARSPRGSSMREPATPSPIMRSARPEAVASSGMKLARMPKRSSSRPVDGPTAPTRTPCSGRSGGCGPLMHVLDQPLQSLGGSLGMDAVAQVEDVARPHTTPLQDGVGLAAHDLPRRLQDERVEIPLDAAVVADTPP